VSEIPPIEGVGCGRPVLDSAAGDDDMGRWNAGVVAAGGPGGGTGSPGE
jgi:hypothetical protein